MDIGTSHRQRNPAHKCTASDNDEDVPGREHRYQESDIQQVASDLRRDGKQSWSENPRLYIILRDIAPLIENDQPQVIDELINDGINDTWLPIFSKSMLKKILPLYPQLHLPFLQAQKSVCTEPSRFRLAYGCPHGHLTRGSPPFRSIREVGAGRASVVDEVESLTDGKLYARKTISRASNLRLARDDIRRFRCEIQTLIRINHWHCVKIVRNSISFVYGCRNMLCFKSIASVFSPEPRLMRLVLYRLGAIQRRMICQLSCRPLPTPI